MIHSPEMTRNTEPRIYSSTRTLGALSLQGHNRAKVISMTRPGEFAFCFGPGWHTKGEVIAKNLDPFVCSMGTTHYGVHPIGAYSIDSQKQAWIDARRNDGFRPAKIYAQSKGALTFSHMFSDPDFRYEFGEVESICFDAPVSGIDSVRHPFRELLKVGQRLPNHLLIEKLCHHVMVRLLSDNPDFDPELLTKEIALENSTSSTQTSLEACITQLEYMNRYNVANFDLHDFGASVANKKIISSSYDSLVNIELSAAIINESYGGGFEHWVDLSRRKGDHATGTERPRGPVDALHNQNRDSYTHQRIKATSEAMARRSIRSYLPRFRGISDAEQLPLAA